MITTVLNPPLTDALIDRLVDIWVATTNAGGAVGFAAPVDRATVEHGVAGWWDRRIDGQVDLVVAEDDGRVAGFGFLEPGTGVSAHMGEIGKLQRDPGLAGRAIGRAVLSALERVARDRGLSRVHLTVRGGTGREAFYAAAGYRQVAVLPGFVRIGEALGELLVMVKDLDGEPATSSATETAGRVVMPVRRLDPDLPMPRYAKPGDAGLDLHARVRKVLPPGTRTLMPTGIAVAIPDGHVGLVHPRSGLAVSRGLSIINAPGTIDAGYRGEILVPLINLDPSATIRLERGDRVAQLLLQRVEHAELVEVEELPDGVRGDGGFGSTGR